MSSGPGLRVQAVDEIGGMAGWSTMVPRVPLPEPLRRTKLRLFPTGNPVRRSLTAIPRALE